MEIEEEKRCYSVKRVFFMKYDYQKYKNYIRSSAWLVKRSELIQHYLSKGWEIRCISCCSNESIQVHHLTYERLYAESVDDLVFLCIACHEEITAMNREEKFEYNERYRQRALHTPLTKEEEFELLKMLDALY